LLADAICDLSGAHRHSRTIHAQTWSVRWELIPPCHRLAVVRRRRSRPPASQRLVLPTWC
jgi:hypothetical protein